MGCGPSWSGRCWNTCPRRRCWPCCPRRGTPSGDLAARLQAWQQAQPARFKYLQFQLTAVQLEVVEAALERLLPTARQERGESPNARGTALYLLARGYLEREGTP
ncbi:MAG: hypothetical protein HY683_06460 [Chloroflexi bacterium]|nr:hypothetical protein [Chloroflexota bacterium]